MCSFFMEYYTKVKNFFSYYVSKVEMRLPIPKTKKPNTEYVKMFDLNDFSMENDN